MNEYAFPKATEELLFVLQKHRENPAPAIDKYLQKFGTRCAQKFLTSATDLFPEEELLDRMREEPQ